MTNIQKALERINTFSTGDTKENLPVTDADERGLYFLTAKGRAFMTGRKSVGIPCGRQKQNRKDILLRINVSAAIPANRYVRQMPLFGEDKL